MNQSRFLKKLLHAEDLSEEDTMLFEHGINILIQDGSEYLSALILSFFLNRTKETLLFLFFFHQLRIRCGGMHADTPMGCYAGFALMYLGLIIFISLPLSAGFCLLLALISAVYLWPRVPSRHVLNPLTAEEYCVNRKLSRIWILIILCVQIVLSADHPMLCRAAAYVSALNAVLVHLLRASPYYSGDCT